MARTTEQDRRITVTLIRYALEQFEPREVPIVEFRQGRALVREADDYSFPARARITNGMTTLGDNPQQVRLAVRDVRD
jgi:hypothetical protein